MPKPIKVILIFVLALLAFSVFWIAKERSGNVDDEAKNETSLFQLIDPKPNLYTQIGKVAVNGKAEPQSLLVAYTSAAGEALQVGNDGKFSFNLELSEGFNELIVTVLDEKDRETTLRSEIYYDDSELVSLEEDIKLKTATKEASPAVKQALLRQELKKEEKNIKVLSGTVSNYLKNTYEIFTRLGPETVNTTQNTQLIKDGKTVIKNSEIKTGDYTVILAKIGTGKIYDAKVVLVSKNPPDDSNTAIFGNISDILKGKLKVILKNGDTKDLKITENFASQFNLEIGQKVAIWAQKENDETLVKKIWATKDPDFKISSASASPSASPSTKPKSIKK